MRWFKHDTDARNDVRLRLLKKRYGAEGYGVYFQLLEIIGEFVEWDNLPDWGYVDKFHSVDTLAEECGVLPEKFAKILAYCNELELLENKNGRLYCAKILKRLDDYAQRAQREANKVRTKSEQSRKSVGTKSDIDKIRIDKIRIDKKRIDKKRIEENKITPKGVTASEQKKEYGDPKINEAIAYLKERLGLPILDGSVQQNRNYCALAIKKFGGLDKVKILIDATAHHAFWRTKVTSFQTLYQKGVQIVSDTRAGVGYGIDATGG